MARLTCCLLLSFLVLLPGKAMAWDLWDFIDPRRWCPAHLDPDDGDDRAGLVQSLNDGESVELQTDSEQQNVDMEHFQQYPELFLMSLPQKLQDMFIREGITPELLGHVCTDKELCKKLNTLLRELTHFSTDQQLKHHQVLRLIVSLSSLLGGAINRVAAYPGLYALLVLAHAPEDAAKGVAGLITAVSLLSSNLVAVSGANTIRCEGYFGVRDVMIAIVAGAATAVDCGMAYYGLTAVSDSAILGIVGIYFMAVGLFPLLSNKVERLPYLIRGEDPKAEMLVERSVKMLGELLRGLSSRNLTLEPEKLQARMGLYRELLGGDDSWVRWILRQACIYSPESRMKNTARMLYNAGVFEGADENQLIPEVLYEQACSRQRSTTGTAVNGGLLIVCGVSATVYAFEDSSSLVGLIERATGQVQCQEAGATVAYVFLQGGALGLMAGKGLGAAQNGAENIRRFVSWLQGCCTEQDEPTTKEEYGLNVLAGGMAVFYSANNIGTMAGNVLASPCLGQGGVAIFLFPPLAGLGAYGFNAGCGPALQQIPVTFKDFIEWLRQRHPGCWPLPGQESLEGIQQYQAGDIALPSVKNMQDIAVGIQTWLSNFQGYENPGADEHSSLTGSYGFAGYEAGGESLSSEESDKNWLAGQDLSADLLNIVGRGDAGNIGSRVRAYLQKLSALIQSRSFKVHSVARDGNCLYQVLVGMFPSLHLNIESLKARLFARLQKILKNRNLSEKEKRFREKVGLQQLASLMRDLLAGTYVDLAMLQLAALELEVDITVIQNDLGDMAIQQIHHNDPAQLVTISGGQIHGAVAVHNGVNHWTWMEPGTEMHDEVVFHAAGNQVIINLGDNTNANNNNNNSNTTCCNGTAGALNMEIGVGTAGILGAWMQ